MKRMILSGLTLLATMAAQAIGSTLENSILPEDSEVEVNDTARMVDLDEVIVVAQPKEQLLMRRQPLSSSAFSAKDLQQLNVRDVRELSSFVPTFVMPVYGSRYTSSMARV